METIKNFTALIISTITWLAGFVGLFSALAAIFTFDLFSLIFSVAALLVMGLGILSGKYSARVQVALEFPLGFLLG